MTRNAINKNIKTHVEENVFQLFSVHVPLLNQEVKGELIFLCRPFSSKYCHLTPCLTTMSTFRACNHPLTQLCLFNGEVKD